MSKVVELLRILLVLATTVSIVHAKSKLTPKGAPVSRGKGRRFGKVDASSFSINEQVNAMIVQLMPNTPEVTIERNPSQSRRHANSLIFNGRGKGVDGFPVDVSIVDSEGSVQGYVLFKDIHYTISGSLEDGELSVEEQSALDYMDEDEVVIDDRRHLQEETSQDPQHSFLRRVAVSASAIRQLQTAQFSIMVRTERDW